MALFRSVSLSETLPAITGAGITLRVPQSDDFSEWATLREASRAFLTPWEPTWPTDDLTRGAFRRRLKRYAEDLRSDIAYAFLIFRSDDNAMVGGLTLANIRRGVAQAGSIGYWIGALRLGSFSLGAVTGTLLAGIVIGQIGIEISGQVKSIFFIMFLFAVGFGVGPQFVRGIATDGAPQALFAVVVSALCLLVVYIAAIVSGPTIPSISCPVLRWKSRIAPSVSRPRIPSSFPASNPSRFRRRWSSATSSPRRNG